MHPVRFARTSRRETTLRAAHTASKHEINDEQRMGNVGDADVRRCAQERTDDACGKAAAFFPRAKKKRPPVLAN